MVKRGAYIILILSSCFLLFGCGNADKLSASKDNASNFVNYLGRFIILDVGQIENKDEEISKKDERTQEELDAKMRESAVKADYNKLQNKRYNEHRSIFVEGEILEIDDSENIREITIKAKYKGKSVKYYIHSFATLPSVEDSIKKGDNIKAYGVAYYEYADPVVLATIIEKK